MGTAAPRRWGGCLALSVLVLGACDLWHIGALGNRTYCAGNLTVWKCEYDSTPCYMGYSVYACAGDEASAKIAGKVEALDKVHPRNPDSLVIVSCTNTGATLVPLAVQPEIMPQGMCGNGGASGAGGAGAGGGAPTCGNAGDPCGLASELPCCSGLCSLSVCE